MTRELAACLLTGLLLAASRLAAQDTTTARADSDRNVILLDITVDPNVNERQVVYLQKGIVYRASFSQPGVILRVRSRKNKQLPFVVPLSNAPDASESSEIEIYPQSDGDIELTPVFNARGVPVTFRLWRDVRATERGQRAAEEGWWELGVDGLVGWHGAFNAGTAESSGSGATFGGCLGVRNGLGPLGFINGCIFGFERLNSSTTPGFFLFTEPEIRLSNGRRTDSGWKFEWGLLIRYAAFGSENDGGNLGGGNLGYGAYLARDQRDLDGLGWRITLMGRMDGGEQGTIDGFGVVTKTTRIWAPAFQLGVGRYH